ncbi:MAG: AMP-binding protein [Candidatus Thorarchaeota archaeon]|jgi:acyl-CoA synthetase (AMP-forming)/AMP-acid ligase II
MVTTRFSSVAANLSICKRSKQSNRTEPWDYVGDWAGRRSALKPKKEAFFDTREGRRFTFQEVDLRANQLARVMMNQGLNNGGHIAIYAKNRFEYWALFFASEKIGTVLLQLMKRLSTTLRVTKRRRGLVGGENVYPTESEELL